MTEGCEDQPGHGPGFGTTPYQNRKGGGLCNYVYMCITILHTRFNFYKNSSPFRKPDINIVQCVNLQSYIPKTITILTLVVSLYLSASTLHPPCRCLRKHITHRFFHLISTINHPRPYAHQPYYHHIARPSMAPNVQDPSFRILFALSPRPSSPLPHSHR